MKRNHDQQLPSELAEVATRLQESRAVATPLELDELKVRARRQAMAGSAFRMKGSFLKSRIAIMSVLALGVFMSGTGATLAVSGSSGSGNATSAQYPDSRVSPQQQSDQGGNGDAQSLQGVNRGPSGQDQGSTAGAPGSDNEQVAAATSGSSLPFTGLAAIPILLMGLALVGGGLMMRRSARQDA